MDTIDIEVGRLADGIKNKHHQDALDLACLLHLTTACMSRLEQSQACNLASMRALQHEAIAALAAQRGVEMDQVHDSLASLNRASTTVSYLAKVPA